MENSFITLEREFPETQKARNSKGKKKNKSVLSKLRTSTHTNF